MSGDLDRYIWDLGFPPWHDVSGRRSVAGQFGQRDRRGVYVLGFANGERYVGRATDVVKRFVQHQAVHPDIVRFTFKRVSEAEIVEEERLCIHTLEARKLPLRNLAEMSVVAGERTFDRVVSPEEQKRWLDGERLFDVDDPRVEDEDLRRRYHTRFEKFTQRRRGDDALLLLGTYIAAVIPFPRRTELTFWSTSCLPSGNPSIYCRVNLNMQEVFTLWEEDEELRVSFHLASSPFEEELGPRWLRRLGDRHSEVALHRYKPGGGDQFRLVVTPQRAGRLLEDPVAVRAMSLFNLRLIRKGPSYYATSHCIDLVTAALATFDRHPSEGRR